MDVETFRGLERLLVITAGALSIYLGYRLFLRMPERREGEGKFGLPGGISIYLSRVGPGVFFALFGAVVVGLSFHYPLVVTETVAPSAGPGPAEAPAQVVTSSRSYFVGAYPAGDREALEQARLRVRDHIGLLNGLPTSLRRDLSESERQAIARGLRNAKLDMIEAVWGDWGDWPAFADWVRLGAEAPPPPGLEAAAALFRHRQ